MAIPWQNYRIYLWTEGARERYMQLPAREIATVMIEQLVNFCTFILSLQEKASLVRVSQCMVSLLNNSIHYYQFVF